MKFYSEVTKELYDTEEALTKAEKAVNDKTAARKADAKLVDDAFKAYKAARDNYNKVLADFCEKHGSYHKTLKKEDLTNYDWDNFFSDLFNFNFR